MQMLFHCDDFAALFTELWSLAGRLGRDLAELEKLRVTKRIHFIECLFIEFRIILRPCGIPGRNVFIVCNCTFCNTEKENGGNKL